MRWTRIGGMTALLAALAVGLALSLGLWSHWTASAQDTFIVNDDTSPAEGGCDTPDFETEDIQDAIDSGLVADGDILVICEGTYNPPDAIEVTKKLTIEGRAEADRVNIVIQSSSDGFVLSVDQVTIRHLTLEGPTPSISWAGINIHPGSDNETISDVEATDWADAIRGIDFTDAVIEGSYLHDCHGGVELHDGARNVMRDNEIRSNSEGLKLDHQDEGLVEGNILSGNGSNILVSGKTHLRIFGNQIDTIGDGISIGPVPVEAFIQIGGSPEKANTFTGPFGGTKYYVRLDCSAENTVNATYNWWGSTNRTDIANRIFNDEDDMGVECPAPDDVKGAVVFHPWASGPAPTPTPSPTPTATATPTATGTPTPTATPGATRSIDLSPQGWHDLAWSGADATDPGTALACIGGDYSIAYAWEGPTAGFKRYVEGCAIPGICNMAALNKYDTLLVNISAAGVSCEMPVAP
jgi:parallel beta-helix repeat protein